MGRRPALQRALPRAPHRAARAGRRRGAAPRRAGLRPAAGPQQAAVGALARRGPRRRPLRHAVQDPPCARRRRQRRRHRLGPVRHLARPRRPRRPPRVGPAPGADTPSCWPRRCSSARRSPPRRRGCARSPAGRATSSGRPARAGRPRRHGVGRIEPGAAVAVQRADRPAPALHVGRRRARALQGDQVLPGRHGQRRRAGGGDARARALPAPPRGHTDGLVLKAMVPVSVRAETQRGALGNRVAAMWAPLPVGVTDPGRFWRRSPRRCAGSRSPDRPSAPWR